MEKPPVRVLEWVLLVIAIGFALTKLADIGFFEGKAKGVRLPGGFQADQLPDHDLSGVEQSGE